MTVGFKSGKLHFPALSVAVFSPPQAYGKMLAAMLRGLGATDLLLADPTEVAHSYVAGTPPYRLARDIVIIDDDAPTKAMSILMGITGGGNGDHAVPQMAVLRDAATFFVTGNPDLDLIRLAKTNDCRVLLKPLSANTLGSKISAVLSQRQAA